MTNNKNQSWFFNYELFSKQFVTFCYILSFCFTKNNYTRYNLSIWHIYDQIINTDPAFINLFENAENLVILMLNVMIQDQFLIEMELYLS